MFCIVSLPNMDSSSFTTVARHKGITSAQFWTAVNIWQQNPHFVCRRLCGSVSLFRGKVLSSNTVYELLSNVNAPNVYDCINGGLCATLQRDGIDVVELLEDGADDITLAIKKLIPRKYNKYKAGLDISIFDKKKEIALFSPLNEAEKSSQDLPAVTISCTYMMQLVGDEMQLCVKPQDDSLPYESLSSDWLKTVLFPKLVKWAQLADPVCSDQVIRSLSLVSVDDYVKLYEELKDKYGKEMVRIWPENTDPAKFVYEDVAIATYLLLLWEIERKEKGKPDWKQSFVDLGCGNGLLVYILSSEGHRGLGIDVRKRGIWDMYPDTTKLQVSAINPFEGCDFGDFDWLIGNHSDELTPWIPVLANRCSYDCSFFLLPCCFYDFAGNKYQRKDTSQSQYGEYLNFVRQICDSCGFLTRIDKLRIPSTKRTCLVGTKRTYLPEDSTAVELTIQSLINSRCEGHSNFKPRESVEKVRNCTRIKSGVIEEVLQIVLKLLLQKPKESSDAESESNKWNAGGNASLKELADSIPKETLLELKSECGGLQTLLRNKRHLFVVAQGLVSLRDPTALFSNPTSRRSSKNKKSWKKTEVSVVKKPCWFNANHPDGCPLPSNKCLFQH